MKRTFSTDAKVGLFILISLGIIAYLTIDISNESLKPGGTYTVYTVLRNASGITKKTPVQIAGIPVGVVSDIQLINNRQARLTLQIKDHVKLTEDMEVQIKSRGVLGDVYLELAPGKLMGDPLKPGDTVIRHSRPGDYQQIFQNTVEITKDLKEITEAIKSYTVHDQSRVANILKNMEVLTKNFATFSIRNAKNMDAVMSNLAALTADLRRVSYEGGEDIQAALRRIDEITETINSGEGTVGRLINDDSTIDKANRVLDNLSDVTDTIFSMKTELGYHLEYLGNSRDAKNYFSVKFRPRPDKYFMIGVVHDPNPPTSTDTETKIVNTDGVISVIETEEVERNKVRFSAQLAKQFKDFTVRGGLIESTGGFGVDYSKGPMNLKVDVFNFGGGGPQVKAIAELNITPSLYILGGFDDITGNRQGFDWVVGAGLRFTDQDVVSVLGGAGFFLSQ